MRIVLACTYCRQSKRQCVMLGSHPPCERCKAFGRSDSCVKAEPGTSALHRRPRRARKAARAHQQEVPTFLANPKINPPTSSNLCALYTPILCPSTLYSSAASTLWSDRCAVFGDGLEPTHYPQRLCTIFRDLVQDSYLRCSYIQNIHHVPSLLQQISKADLEPYLLYAMLAVSIRLPGPADCTNYDEIITASNDWAARAYKSLDVLPPSHPLPRVQALILLIVHSWEVSDADGLRTCLKHAVQIVREFGLCKEPSKPDESRSNMKDFIRREEMRRAAWSCFLYDGLLSERRSHSRLLQETDMQIQLPCENETFCFGEPVSCEQLTRGHLIMHPYIRQAQLSILSYTTRISVIWEEVGQWTCSDLVCEEPPWEVSRCQVLLSRINSWKSDLPHRLRYRLGFLRAHFANNSGQDYVSMWAVYHLTKMSLYRAYIPLWGLLEPQDLDESSSRRITQSAHPAWDSWQQDSTRDLFKASDMVCDITQEIYSYGLAFLCSLPPLVGFAIYTAIGVQIYLYHFHEERDNEILVGKAKDKIKLGYELFEKAQLAWPIAKTWCRNVVEMHDFYRVGKSRGDIPVRTDSPETTLHEDSGSRSPLSDFAKDYEPSIAFNPRHATDGIHSVSSRSGDLQTTPQSSGEFLDNWCGEEDSFENIFGVAADHINNSITHLELVTRGFWTRLAGDIGTVKTES